MYLSPKKSWKDCLGTTRVHVLWGQTARHMDLSVYGFFLMKAWIWTSKISFALNFGNNTSSSPACWSLAFFLAFFTWKSSMQQGLLTHMVRNPPICSLIRYIHSFSSHSSGLLIGRSEILQPSEFCPAQQPLRRQRNARWGHESFFS